MKTRSIFLSSESDSSLPIVDFCRENDLVLVRKSLLSFGKIPFELPAANEWDVVFFASPRSVDFFISGTFSLAPNQQFACIGPETKKHLETLGYEVSFYGEQAGNPKEVAAQFKDWLGDRRALFPQSAKSNKSIESELPESQKIPLVVYDTIHDPVRFLNPFSVYVFTSPSNYRSFVAMNTLPEEAKVIAWGHSTAEVMMDDDAPVHFILDTSTYSELLEIIQKILAEN